MNNEVLTALASSAANLNNVLADLLKKESSAQDTPPVEKKTRGRKKKVEEPPVEEMEFDSETEETDTDDFDFGGDDDGAPVGTTLDEVRDAFTVFIKKFKTVKDGRAMAEKVLKKFGVKKTTELAAEQYDEVIELLAKKK